MSAWGGAVDMLPNDVEKNGNMEWQIKGIR